MAGIDNKRPDDWATYFWAGDREEPEVGGRIERATQIARPEVRQPPHMGRPGNEADRFSNFDEDRTQAVSETSGQYVREAVKKPRRGVTSRRTLTFIGLAFALNLVAVFALVLTNDGDQQDTLSVEVVDSDDFAEEDSLKIQIPLNPGSDALEVDDNGVPVDTSLIPLQMVISDGKLKLKGTATSEAQAKRMIDEASAVFEGVPLVKEYQVNPAAPTANKGVVVQKPVVFEPGSDVIRKEFYAILDACADVMEQNPSLVMNVSGHTDSDGSAEYNLILAEARAQAVIDYYAGQGLDRKKFENTPAGETAPIASNETDDGKETNRRTDLNFQGIFDGVIQESGPNK